MHASAFWRKGHPHAAAREVENSGSRVPAGWMVCRYPKLCASFSICYWMVTQGGQLASRGRANCGRWMLLQSAPRQQSNESLPVAAAPAAWARLLRVLQPAV